MLTVLASLAAAVALQTAPAPQSQPQTIPATCYLNGGEAVRCQVAVVRENGVMLIAFLDGTNMIGFAGPQPAAGATKLNVGMIGINDQTAEATGYCAVSENTVTCSANAAGTTVNIRATVAQ